VRGGRDKSSGKKKPGKRKESTRQGWTLRLQLKSNPEALSLVRAAVERAAELLHFGEVESRAIVRSVDEGLANVIRHAYGGKGGRPIEVACYTLPDPKKGRAAGGIEVILRDSGTPIDPSKLKGRPLDDLRPGGLGLHFMKESMDKVEFSRQKGKNQLRLVKYLT
jgi:serine/threonine-protein kinase RsbW